MCLSPKSVKYLVRNGNNILAPASCESIHIFGKMVFVLSGGLHSSQGFTLWGMSFVSGGCPILLSSGVATCGCWLKWSIISNYWGFLLGIFSTVDLLYPLVVSSRFLPRGRVLVVLKGSPKALYSWDVLCVFIWGSPQGVVLWRMSP